MIYGLVNENQSDADRIEIAKAILNNDYQIIQKHVNNNVIIHVMQAPINDLYCIYCRIPIFATDQRSPRGTHKASNPWHFEHRRIGDGDRPAECVGNVRKSPTYLHGIGIENPSNQGCYIQLGYEIDSLRNPTKWGRTRCRTIQCGKTYCHLAKQVSPPCI